MSYDKKFENEIFDRLGAKLQNEFGSSLFYSVKIFLHLGLFGIISLFSLFFWGKVAFLQYLFQTIIVFILCELLFFIAIFLLLVFYVIPKEIYDELSNKVRSVSLQINPPITINIELGEEINEEINTFKILEIHNASSQDLFSCEFFITKFQKEILNNNWASVKLKSVALIWTNSNNDVQSNKVTIKHGIPSFLYLFRISHTDHMSYLMCKNPIYTPLEKGKYSIQIRLDSINCSSKDFSMLIECDGNESVQIVNISPNN